MTHTQNIAEISDRTKLEAIITDARIAKTEAQEKVRELINQSDDVNQERLKLEAAIADAERRLNLNSGSRGTYADARADLVARAMMGEQVDIETAATSSALDALNADDVKAGLRALKQKYDDCRARWRGLQGQLNAARKTYAAQHGVEHIAHYLIARESLVNTWFEIRAAQEVFNENNEFKIPVFTGMNFDDLVLPGICDHELTKTVRAVKKDACNIYRGESMRQSGATVSAMERIKSEFANLKGV